MAPAGSIRVLFVQGAGVRSGAERALLARIRHLPEHGVEPVVAFLSDGPFRAEVEQSGVATVLLPEAPRVRQPARLPGAVLRLAGAARRERAEVLEGCGEKMSLLAGWAARAAGRGCVYNLQDAPRRSLEATVVQLGAAAGRHDAVVVPSRWMARSFRRLGLRPRVIPNAVVLEDLPGRSLDIRGPAGWDSAALVVGLFGRLVAWKGAEVMLGAARRVLGDHPETRFLVVGGTLYGQEPDYEPRLRAQARELGLAERLHFAGHREDALALMAGCDAVCHCSIEREPFGMVVLEAMALGKPVVATRTGGPEEMIDHGRTGMLVDPGDEPALAAAIDSLVRDPGARAELGRAARAEARDRFDSAAVGASLAALYREV
ncbi:MAG TPA: glycosyltransferase family 4 protein, partial [Thermoleophilaceae bacterium]